MRYKKKPIIIHAEQFVEGNEMHEEFLQDGLADGVLFYESGNLYCKTLEGNMLVKPMNYIIQGVRGELYPCDMDIFDETYEEVS